MAKFETSAGIEDMTGKLGKKSVLTMLFRFCLKCDIIEP